MAEPLSLRAYAKLRGCSAQSVSKAISSGRLVQCVVRVGGEPKIGDAAVADAEWAANTDHTKAPGYVKERGLEPAGVAPSPPAQRTKRAAVTPLSSAVAREKNARADLAELEYRTKAGALVSAAAVEAAWGDMVSEMRTAVLAVPSKFKGLYPALEREQVTALTELLCRALESLVERSKPAAAVSA